MKKSVLSKLLAALLLAVMYISDVHADDWKTVETSEKRLPQWVKDGNGGGMLMVMAEAPSLQEARQLAEKNLFSSIVQAVAANVVSSSKQVSTEESVNGSVNSREEFTGRLEIAAARLPFIKGVSLSEARQYWERRENKKTHQKLYVLTVSYPMPDSELRKMRTEFEAYDREKSDEYSRLESGISSVSSVEDINEAIASLESLQEYFFDSVRLSQAAGLQQRYRDLFRMVTLTGEQIGPNEFILRTQLRDVPFVTGKIPEVTSECASRIKVTPNPGGSSFNVTFSSEDCLENENNSLKASMRLQSARLNVTLHF
ncbi:MAG: hypothetical protein K2M16_01985 [Muribaculaceae bacterium]|nr:hypothetical protein [Muribaculaceae bacterium]